MDRNPSEHECRRRVTEMLLDFEMACLEENFGEEPGSTKLHYDEAHDIFRFSDGTFALGRQYANWVELEKRGYKTW